MLSTKQLLLRATSALVAGSSGVARDSPSLVGDPCDSVSPMRVVWGRFFKSLAPPAPSVVSCQKRFTSHGADGISSASIVVTDPEAAAKKRDRMARELLSSNSGLCQEDEPTIINLKGLEHTIPYRLAVVLCNSRSTGEFEAKAAEILRKAFHMVDYSLNCFNPESELSRVNSLPVGEKHQMSEDLRHVMECTISVHHSSGMGFDPAAGPIISRLRGAMRDHNDMSDISVTEAEVELFSLAQSFDVDLEEGTIARKHSEARLDLGGVNKGYTVDYVVDHLRAAGMPNVLFEWGGDIRASGRNIKGNLWAVAIKRPPSVEEVIRRAKGKMLKMGEEEQEEKDDDSPSLLHVVELDDEALCTSGDYENVLYHPKHGVAGSIFDWQRRGLLSPEEGALAQVSVKCYSAMYADALATVCLVKRDAVRIRYLLEGWRYVRSRVTNYFAYTRQGERLAHMHEIAQETRELREIRIAGSLPSRIVIVGGGLAGLSAAIEAASCGAQVILMEKEGRIGGNSAKATSGINGWGTRTQAKSDILDGGKYFERDTFLSGVGGTTDPALVKVLSVKSGDAIGWLTSLGVPLSVLSQLGGHSFKRTHRAPDKTDGTPLPIGHTIMRTLEDHIRNNLSERVTIMTHVSVTELLHETDTTPDGASEVRVTGVRYRDLSDVDGQPSKLLADAVVLATGGFSNDREENSLLCKYAPHLASFPTTNGPWATGDGVKLATSVGAKLVDMDKVQLHPTGLIDPKDPANTTKILGPEALRGSGGILLNKQGKRFVNELDLRSVVSKAINTQGNEYPGSGGCYFAYCVLNEDATNLFGGGALGFYGKKLGLFQRAETVEELAKLIGCDEGELRDTLEKYETCSKAKVACPVTGKVVFPCVVGTRGPYNVAFVTPSIHYTMGGCLISPAAEVLQEYKGLNILENHRPIRCLFGAGEVTGGVHGGNRLGGNSLLECVVFGKIAGDRAATILQKREIALSKTSWTSVVVRESRSGEQFGTGSRVLRFNLPGALQRTGLNLGEFVAIRGEWDGQQLVGYFSPITLPEDLGTISLLVRADKGTLKEWICALRPGDSVEIKACGGLRIDQDPVKKCLLFRNRPITRFALVAAGTGVAPMLQVIRAALKKPYVDTLESIRLIYAAEEYDTLTYRSILQRFAEEFPDKFVCNFVLNNPPEGWTGGVGFVNKKSLQKVLQPPSSEPLIVVCGPPVMQRDVKNELLSMGYDKELVHTVDGESGTL
ncbi:NADH-dependent fumarate reductase [Trypanosoma equiperdum]|uniref:fumarate reductase (NADH) n=3 Tax=Trypanozoon TaxID=39700 RepID=Q38BN4_TRYB2|nr:NADH-dependent fumarate reductase, putative [Trypanosoma brucei gambiense DAL972]XP_822614.1 NADH-dependent fumarate reductase, putative [Trypanosoma brucei brucei TREU927]EAN77786.1 NADH-dependent fumarate reductase, putative [Trypanosoma brucei brucei TREU927]CBH15369.1 NADH-dependent fumarate reductase, putative [Trypanosoma brucei gambiense DAL972]SCU71016.1 NADH-dependent fumarate reductase [Trypanosoma equiperdum]|eukprot:XP_011777633.1 NADH-dependent fumarate reductase, putative [Trypanosoma brucei gambiense DAL972]